MDNIIIGEAELQFNENGRLSSSNFRSTLNLEAGQDLLRKYADNNVQPNEMDIKLIGELTLSKFFSTITEIELADREKYQITSQILLCEKYANGNVKRCVLEYRFTPLV